MSLVYPCVFVVRFTLGLAVFVLRYVPTYYRYGCKEWVRLLCVIYCRDFSHLCRDYVMPVARTVLCCACGVGCVCVSGRGGAGGQCVWRQISFSAGAACVGKRRAVPGLLRYLYTYGLIPYRIAASSALAFFKVYAVCPSVMHLCRYIVGGCPHRGMGGCCTLRLHTHRCGVFSRCVGRLPVCVCLSVCLS